MPEIIFPEDDPLLGAIPKIADEAISRIDEFYRRHPERKDAGHEPPAPPDDSPPDVSPPPPPPVDLNDLSFRLKRLEKYRIRLPRGYDLMAPQDILAWVEAQEKSEAFQKARDVEAKQAEERQKREPRDPHMALLDMNCTHYGNGCRFIHYFGKDVKYCPPFEWWYIWTPQEGRWKKDEMGVISEMGKETVLRLYGEAESAPTEGRRKEVASWAMKCEKPTAVTQLLESARSDPLITVHFDVFDPNPMELNLKNGWYDFKERKFHPHDRDHFFTMMLPVEYDPEAKCPTWLAFLDRIFRSLPEKEKLIAFLQRAVGYSLTGVTKERAIFLMYGLGSNGKTVFVTTLESLFGDYGTSVSSATFTTAMATNVRNDLARLKGKRFVWASENSTETVLDEELVKRVTGGDTVVCRFLFKEEFEYRPNFKVWWIFNNKPKIRDATDSIWDRIHLIPCEERIPKAEQDKELTAKIRQELPGVLNWALQGYAEYVRLGGLDAPAAVQEATQEYRSEEDLLADFLDEWVEVVEQQTIEGGISSDARCPFPDVWKAWVVYTTTNKEKKYSKKWLGHQIGAKFKTGHTKKSRYVVGIRLKKNPDDYQGAPVNG